MSTITTADSTTIKITSYAYERFLPIALDKRITPGTMRRCKDRVRIHPDTDAASLIEGYPDIRFRLVEWRSR